MLYENFSVSGPAMRSLKDDCGRIFPQTRTIGARLTQSGGEESARDVLHRQNESEVYQGHGVSGSGRG